MCVQPFKIAEEIKINHLHKEANLRPSTQKALTKYLFPLSLCTFMSLCMGLGHHWFLLKTCPVLCPTMGVMKEAQAGEDVPLATGTLHPINSMVEQM
jgi:hypothetical protein